MTWEDDGKDDGEGTRADMAFVQLRAVGRVAFACPASFLRA